MEQLTPTEIGAWIAIITGLGAAIGVGLQKLVTVWLDYRKGSGVEDRTDSEFLFKQYREQIAEIRKEWRDQVKELKDEVNKLKIDHTMCLVENAKLQERVARLEEKAKAAGGSDVRLGEGGQP